MKIVGSKVALEQRVSDVIRKIKAIGGDKVRFIILYGSAARGGLTKLSDIDLAVFYDGDREERFGFRVKILGRVGDEFDIQTFQDLPVYMQKEILSRGNVVYFKDYRETFGIFLRIFREFEDLKPRLELYYSSLGV